MLFMIIKSSACLKNEYDDISDLCKTRKEPIFLTKDGEGDLVVMSMEEYSYREEILDLREKLLEAEAKRLKGDKTYSLNEVNKILGELIDEIE